MPLAEHLADSGLIRHKDRAVRVLAACALANILRLFAPDAPYSPEQLLMMFNLFIQQLRGVAEPDSPYYVYHYFLLESLSTVKSVVLIFDLDEGTQLQHQLITTAFELMHPTLQKNVRLYLIELVLTLIEEGDAIPADIVQDLLIGNITAMSSNGHADNASVMAMVQDLVKQCGDKLQGHFGQYFNEQLTRIARKEDTEAIVTKIGREAHEFAVNLLKLSPSAGTIVLKLMEEELKAEDPELRCLAIQTLGRLFSGMSGSMLVYPTNQRSKNSTFTGSLEVWLQRRQDKAIKCRNLWVQAACSMFAEAVRLGNNQGIIDALTPFLVERLEDPEERVRVISLQSISTTLLPLAKSTPRRIIEAVSDRCMDRKDEIQHLARSISSSWLLNCLRESSSLESFYACTGRLCRSLILSAFSESRLHALTALSFLDVFVFAPICELPGASGRRLWFIEAALMACDSPNQQQIRNALQTALKHKAQFSKAWLAFAKLARVPRPLSGVLQSKSLQLAQFLAELLPSARMNSLEVQRTLIGLADLPAGLLNGLIAISEARSFSRPEWNKITAQLQASTVPKPLIEVILGSSSSSSGGGGGVGCLSLASPQSLPSSLVSDLSTMASAGKDNPLSTAAGTHLQDILAEFPQMFANRTEELMAAVMNSGGDAATLNALAAYTASSKIRPEMRITDKLTALLNSIIEGAEQDALFIPKRVAAATLISVHLGLHNLPSLIQHGILQLTSEGEAGLCAAVSLSAVIQSVPEAAGMVVPHFEALFELAAGSLCSEAIISQILKEEPSSQRRKRPTAARANEDARALLTDWPSVAQLRSLSMRKAILAIRLLVALVSALIRQHTRLAGNNHEMMSMEDGLVVDLDVVSSIRSLVVGFLLSRLSLVGTETNDGNVFVTRIKYNLLKGLLTCLPDASVADVTTHTLQPLLPALQDSDHRLRLKLVLLLGKLIRSRRVAEAFTPLLFFAGAHERLPAIKTVARNIIGEVDHVRSRLQQLLPVLIVYLAHYSDYADVGTSSATRALVMAHFAFLCELGMRAENSGAIYTAIGRLKLYHIPSAQSISRRMFCVAELAQMAVKQFAAQHHWPLTCGSQQETCTVPLSLLVPDVLTELSEVQQLENIHRVYLDEESRGAQENKGQAENYQGSRMTGKAVSTKVASAMIKRNRRSITK